MNFFQFEVLLTVVETGNFTKAGEQIGLTQSGVSHNINSLEKELDIVLLNRGRNGITLTTAGTYIIEHMRSITDNLAHIKQKVAAFNGMTLGKLAVGSFPSFSAKYMPSFLSRFKEKFPNIEVQLYEGGYTDIIKWVQDGIVDIGFAALPLASVDFEHLLYDPLTAVIYENHPFSQKDYIHIADLKEEAFIMLQSGCETLIEENFREAKITPTISYRSRDNQTVLSMVQNKLGLTIMPKLALPEQLVQMRAIPLETEIVRDIGLITKTGKESTIVANEFSKMVKGFFEVANYS